MLALFKQEIDGELKAPRCCPALAQSLSHWSSSWRNWGCSCAICCWLRAVAPGRLDVARSWAARRSSSPVVRAKSGSFISAVAERRPHRPHQGWVQQRHDPRTDCAARSLFLQSTSIHDRQRHGCSASQIHSPACALSKTGHWSRAFLAPAHRRQGARSDPPGDQAAQGAFRAATTGVEQDSVSETWEAIDPLLDR